MENEIKKYLDEKYPLNYAVMDKEEAQENYQTKLERIAFRDGVEWALKQVKNNGVLINKIKKCKDAVVEDMEMCGYPVEAPLVESLVDLIKLIEKL